MELGNWIFGNSRGPYPIPRGVGWEEELYRLFDALDLDEYGWPRGVEEGEGPKSFENDVFWIMPYYWGECTCGWDEIDNGQERLERLKHRPECVRWRIWRLERRHRNDHKRFLKALKMLYRRRGWPTEGDDWWHGCLLACDCDYRERRKQILCEYAQEFGHEGHKPDCLLVINNFHYKPTGFGIQWYKYPLRDAYMSQEISLEEFCKIIDHCLESIVGVERK